MLLFIIGFSGAGKSSLAEDLSRRWKVPAYDLDRMFETSAGMTISDFTAQKGWEAFRALESELFMALAHDPEHHKPELSGIVATGGGIVLNPAHREILARSRVLWLSPPWETLLEQIHKAPSALLKDKTDEQILALYQERLPLYRSVMS
ncbi:MAG TPA: shikimate kinase [Candidatus Cloacimonadota bacterium]|nr:shikimate kinase [Candidatus Cloacimonadota bacterium]